MPSATFLRWPRSCFSRGHYSTDGFWKAHGEIVMCEVCGAKFHHCQSCPSCPRFVQEPSNLVLKILNLPNPFLRLQGILKAYTFRRACEGCFLHPVSKARGCLTNAWSGDAITRAWLVIVSSYRFDFDSCYLVLLYLSSMIQHYSEESSGY